MLLVVSCLPKTKNTRRNPRAQGHNQTGAIIVVLEVQQRAWAIYLRSKAEAVLLRVGRSVGLVGGGLFVSG